MRVVAWIARREVVEALRNRSLTLFAAVLALLLLIGGGVGFAANRQQTADRDRLQALVAQQWQNQPDRHPHRVAHYGFIAFREQGPLSFFDFGVDSFTGNSIFLEAHRQNPANFSEARHSPSMLRFGQLSLAYVLQNLMPLLIFFLAFNSLTREREQGTLPLLLCQGVAARQLYAGKVLGGAAVLGLVWLPTVVLSSALLLLTPQAQSPELWQRAGLLFGIYSLYFLIWLVLAVWVSARSRTSSAALMVLLSIWAVLFVFVPRGLPNLAERFWPSPSKPEFELNLHLEVARQGNGHDPKDPQFTALKNQLLQKHGKHDVAELPVNFNGVAMRTGEAQSSQVYARHFHSLQELYGRQNQVAGVGAWFDPYLAVHSLSMSLCQTDFDHFVSFARQAEAYRFELVDRLNQLHIHEVAYQGDKEQRVSREHWREFKAFRYQPPGLRQSLDSGKLSLAALLAWLLMLSLALARTRLEAR